MKFIAAIIFAMLTFEYAHSVCDLKESTSKDGGYKLIQIGKNKLEDVDSFRVVDEKLFYAISPVYGKPEIGVVDCDNAKKIKIVAAKNLNKAYPDGADFFRIKEVTKDPASKNTFLIHYYYSSDVDTQDFKNFEIEKNLKSAKFTEK